jgi:hypothetical protein
VWFLWSIGSWSLLKAEWTVINNNLRLLLVGQYDQTQLGRVATITLVMVALSGLSMGLWARVARTAFLGLAVAVVLLFLVPLFSCDVASSHSLSGVRPTRDGAVCFCG